MEYLDKLRKLFDYKDIAKKRNEQLQREEIFDKYWLKPCTENKECAPYALQYMLLQRQMNRRMMNQFHKADIIDHPEIAEKHILVLDKLYYMNPIFLDRWDTNDTLSNDDFTKSYMPYTIDFMKDKIKEYESNSK